MKNNESKHQHQHCCQHPNIEHCPICDVAYCVDCGEEWKKNDYNTLTTTNPIYFPSTTTYPWIGGGTSVTIPPCSHTTSLFWAGQ